MGTRSHRAQAIAAAERRGWRKAVVPTINHFSNLLIRFIYLAGIKFDDGLLIGDGMDFVARGNPHHNAFEGLFIKRKPIRHGAAGGLSWRESIVTAAQLMVLAPQT